MSTPAKPEVKDVALTMASGSRLLPKIPLAAEEYLNEPAKDEYRQALERYADDLFKEASRLEGVLTDRSGGTPEITRTMVKDADLLFRHGYRRTRKSWQLICAQVVAFVGGIATGFLSNVLTSGSEAAKKPVTMVCFLAIMAMTIFAFVYSVLRD
jgi:hypothetical protein